MAKKSPFPYRPGDRVNVPGKRNTQGLISFPARASDAQCPLIGCTRNGDPQNEGRIVFVAWIGDDGTRERGYFTEAALESWNRAI